MNDFEYSKQPEVAELQHKLLQKAEALKESQPPEQTPNPADRDTAVCRFLMKGESLLEVASPHHPEFQGTQVTMYLLGAFQFYKRTNALILGDTGSGKSTGAMAWLLQVVTPVWVQGQVVDCDGAFITAFDMAQLVAGKKWATLRRLARVPYLVIDDLGTEIRDRTWKQFLPFFENLIAERHQYQRRTVITSNATPEQIRESYGSRVCSRLNQKGGVYTTDDPDFRSESA